MAGGFRVGWLGPFHWENGSTLEHKKLGTLTTVGQMQDTGQGHNVSSTAI